MTNVHPEPDPHLDPRIARTHEAIASAVQHLLADEGWDAVTHQRVSQESGYARNTVYRHFPDRASLLIHGANFERSSHATPTGDLRADLIGELSAFRRELFTGVAGQVIGALLERADRDPQIAPIRDQLIQEGAGPIAELIEAAIEAGLLRANIAVKDHVALFCGPVLYARLVSNEAPTDDTIETLVDLLLGG